MNTGTFKTELWHQFGAAIEMFENAIKKCPDNLWHYNYRTGNEIKNPKDLEELRSSYWYIAYHTLFFLDFYLDLDPENFRMPEPFKQTEENIDEILIERVYTKDELLGYTVHCRKKLRSLLQDMDESKAALRWKTSWRDFSIVEMCLYNMRHVMHHTGQLNMMLGKKDHDLPIWVSQTKINLE